MEQNKFLDKFTMFAMRLGGQVHLRTLRDAFAAIMPMFILAGIAVLVNNVVFTWFLSGESLATAQHWGRVITNGTLSIASLLIAPAIAYSLCKYKDFKNPIAAIILSMSALIVMMPNVTSITPIGGDSAVPVIGVLHLAHLGTSGMFAGIIIGLLSTELFIRVSSIKRLKINLGDDVPPAVGDSFSALFPVMIVMSFFGIIAFVLFTVFDTDLISLISVMVQEPLRRVNTSLWGVLFIYSFGNFLFTLGIHQSVVNGVLLRPLLIANNNENMLAFANGEEIPHIMTDSFVNTFGMIGGTGSTIALVIATLLFGKLKSSKSVAKLGTGPGVFNINEPIIFGYPIIFNVALMIPFVLAPTLGIVVAYTATVMGFMDKTVILIPWTTPPLISAYLATAGDWRAVVVQLIIIVGAVLLYLPFMKIHERMSLKLAAEQEKQDTADEEAK